MTKAARLQHFFPLVGLVVGLLVSLVAMILGWMFEEELSFVSAGLLLVFMYCVTGILHTEGLADFADGVMANGTKERKREVMKDVHAGVAAVLAVVIYLLLMFSLSATILGDPSRRVDVFPLPWEVVLAMGFVLAEMSGKLAMNTAMYLGPSSHAGMGSMFVGQASAGKLFTSMAIAGVVAVLIAGWLFAMVYIGVIAGVAVTLVARKNFGGVAGDSFGAANEVGRAAALLMWVLLI
jgi:adenosylcobinamide-GDP ribazoletransferase